jgi:hydrogenase-4 component B
MTALWTTGLWVAALAAPLALAALLLPAVTRAAAVRWSPLACLPAGLLALAGPADGLSIPWLLLGVRLELDDVSRPLLGVTALLYAVALAVSPVERAGDRRLPAFLAVFLVTYTGNVTLLTAADIVTFYVGFAVMSLTAYGLVVHFRTDRAMRAGRVYLGLALVGEVLLLSGLMAAAAAAGTDMAAVREALGDRANLPAAALIVAGLGVKAGLVPLHGWLPVAHPAAPVPASAVLSGAMVKAGLVGWLHLLPIGTHSLPELGSWLVALGLVGIFGAVVLGLLQDEPKVQLAYSTISQMGYLAVTVGAGLREASVGAAAVTVAVVYAVAHGTAKAALFLSIPVVQAAAPGARRWIALGGAGVAGFALAGLPPLNGFVAKYGLKDLAAAAGVSELVLSLGAAGTVLLMARFWLALAAGDGVPRPWSVLQSGWLVLLLAGPAGVWALTAAGPAVDVSTTVASVWAGVWPVLLGLVLVVLAVRGAARWPLRRSARPPAGDVVVVLEPAAVGALRALDEAGRLPGRAVQAVVTIAGHAASRWPGGAAELLRLPGWQSVGPLAVVVLVVLAGVLLW